MALAAEVAEGWYPLFLVAEAVASVWGEALADGASRRSADLPPLEICAGGVCAIGDGPRVEGLRDLARPELALYIGGMGARGANFYNELFCRFGWESAARQVQDLFLAGDRARGRGPPARRPRGGGDAVRLGLVRSREGRASGGGRGDDAQRAAGRPGPGGDDRRAQADRGVSRFTLTARGPFSLAAAIGFLEAFTPAGYEGAEEGPLDLAFPAERGRRAVGVRVRQDGGEVVGDVVHAGRLDPEGLAAVARQVGRILSLDVDGEGFATVGDRDAVVAGLQRLHPGLRPVLFWSPYEAAAWAIIGQRIRIRQAAAIKARMARELGEPVELGGRVLHAFPAPERLAEVEAFPGLSARKPEWLRALAAAALDGRLDAARLRALPRDDALAELRELPGIGPFSAELVLVRGAGDPDHVPTREPRLARAVALAYGLASPPSDDDLRRISEAWRPYRSWVTLLLRAGLDGEASGVATRPAPGP